MANRSKQSRRTPQSSSGTIISQEVRPNNNNNEHARSSSGLASAGAYHHSNPSFPILPRADSPNDRMIKSLVDKLNTKLPCYSGNRLSDVEENESVRQLVEGLVQLSRRSINQILLYLFEGLDKLNKRYRDNLASKSVLDILESELFVLRLTIRLLTFHWNTHVEGLQSTSSNTDSSSKLSDDTDSTPRSASTATTPLSSPPVLGEKVVDYILCCVCTYLRRAGPSRIEHLIFRERTEDVDRLRDMRIFERDSAVLHAAHHVDGDLLLNPLSKRKSSDRVSYDNGNSNNNANGGGSQSQAPIMSFPIAMNGSSRVAPYIPSALTVVLCSVTGYSDILAYLSYLAGCVIYRISATNWPNVLSRIKVKLRSLASDPHDEGDVTELLFIIYSLTNKDRLIEFLQLLQSLLVNMGPNSQSAIAVILRLVVWRWINDFGREYADVFQSSRRRLEGQPERIFDVLYQLTTSANRRMFWPTLATLLVISPERLQAAEAALTGSLVYGKRHNNLLEIFHGAITTQPKLGETVMRCYNDICKAAYLLPPVLADGTLHVLASDLADELKIRMVNPPESRPFYESLEAVDVNLYAESTVTVLRYNQILALKGIFPVCFEPTRSPAVKLCIVRALIIYVVEAVSFAWQPPLDNSIYQFIAPRLRSTMTELFGTAGRMSPFPTALREKDKEKEQEKDEPSSQIYHDRKDLLLAIQTLWRIDNGFLFSGMDENAAMALVSNSTNIVHKHPDPSVQATVLRTFGTVLSRISDPSAEYLEEMNFFMFHSSFMVMRGAALKILENPDDLELGKMNLGTSLAILSQLLDTTSLDHVEWKYNEERTTCLAVLEIALLTLLTSARIDVCSFAARGLRLMAQVGQDSILPGPTYYTDDKPASFMTLLESVGDPKSLVLGRVEFQKRARLVTGPLSCPCKSQLAAWREGYYRWSFLHSLIHASDTRSSSEKSSSSLDGHLFGRFTMEERQWTWENLTLMLAVSSGSCLSDDTSFNAPAEYRLPSRRGFSDEKPSRLMRRFINELVDILASRRILTQLAARDTSKSELTSRWITAQPTARAALGSELNSKWFPLLLESLDSKVKQLVVGNEDAFYDPVVLAIIEQIISVLNLVLERITVAESAALTVDLGNMLVILSKFINQSFERNFDVRNKTKVCAIVDIIREKMLLMKNDNVTRNSLFQIIIDWVWEPVILEDPSGSRVEPVANYMDVTIAALKTMVNLSDGLQLWGSSGKTTDDMDLNVPSRLFRRYLAILLRELEPKRKDIVKHSSQVQALVVAAIANLLSANPTAGARHVLSLSFNSSARLRTVFCHVFSHVLSRNVNFDEYHETFLLTSRKSRLCELVKEHDLLLYAIIDICPSGETEAISTLLLNLFNTQKSTLNLLRVVINRQVAIAENPTELFRANDICGRIFSGFAKSHGYVYLRSIISPLIVAMQTSPEGTSYEVDPSKIKPENSQKENASNLQTIAAVFLQIMTESWIMVPDLLRESCRLISDAVQEKWGGEGYTAIGAFFFLRFVVPAITSPETIDLEVPRDGPRSQSIKRGLILVAKIVQNIVNNIFFGKEAHMKVLNGLLTENITRIVQFYKSILFSSPVERSRIHSDELLGSLYDEADTLVLHRFFENHQDKIGELLLGYKAPPSVIKPCESSSGKMTWDDVCNLLVDGRSTMRPPIMLDKSSAERFRALWGKNYQTNVEPVRDIFQSLQTWGDVPSAFVLYIASIDVETVDFELLMHHTFETIRNPIRNGKESFDVIVDFTGFTASSEIPLSWVRTLIETTPSEIPEQFRGLYLVNINAAAQAFLRKLYYLSPGLRFCKRIVAVSSVSELINDFHPSTVATLELANSLEAESGKTCFTCQQHLYGKLMTPTTIYVGESHLRIVSVKPQPIYPGLSCKTVEIVPYADIRDIALSTTRNDHHEFVIRRFVDASTLTFWSIEKEREKFVEMARSAKGRIKPNESVSLNERARHSVITMSLLATAFYGICDENESLRESAFSLLSALCKSLKFHVSSIISLKDAGISVPKNTTAYICSFSERLSNFIPALTLDFIAEVCLGFEVATPSQRILILQYLHPWIKNLAYFGDPAHELYDPSQSKLKDIIGSLIDISIRFSDIFPCTLRWVWVDFNKFETQLSNFVLDALIQTAVDGGIDSQRCEQIGDILIAISTIDVRARVLKKLKIILSKPGGTTRSLAASSFWPETTAISRLLLKTGYAARLSLHAQLYMPEAVHFVTMLCSTGLLYMKSTVYGIAMNLVQNLRVLRLEAGASVVKLDELMKEMGTNEILNNFGLTKVHPNSDIVSADDCPDQISIAALENITELFIRALTYAGETQEGDGNGNGLLNVWRARWMSLVSSTAFQQSPYVQYRSFVVMGVLASSGVLAIDENMLYQTLIAFKTALQSGQDEDPSLIMSMIHFMARVLPGFESNSSYLPRLFWLTLALLQSTFSSLYEESANLLGVIVETMSKQGYFMYRRMSLVLLDAREDISVILAQLDTMMGVSFDAAFSFSLAAIIFRAMRSPALQPTAKKLLRNVTKVAAESLKLEASRKKGRLRLSVEVAPDGSMLYLDYEVMGYFLALLPFACTSSSYRKLLCDAGVTESWWPPLSPNSEFEDNEDDDGTPLVDPTIFHLEEGDTHTPLLIISFLFAISDCYQGSETEQAFIFALLVRLGEMYPDITAAAVAHFQAAPHRGEWLIDSLVEVPPARSNAAAVISSSVQTLFRIAMTNPVWETMLVPTIQGSLEEQRTNHWRALEELDMHILAAHWKIIPRSEAWKILQWIPALLDGVTITQ